MNYGVSKFIDSLHPRIFSSPFPNYTSEPANDLNSPGVNLRLFSDVVPISSTFQKQQTLKVPIDADTSLKQDNNQEGSGLDSKVEHSFLHPRPVKTELIEVFKQTNDKKKDKRQLKQPNEKNEDIKPSKKLKLSHKFQVV